MDVEQKMPQEPEQQKDYGAAADFVLGVAFLAFSLFILREAIKMPIKGGKMILSPGLIPTGIGILLVLLTLALLISTVKQKGPGLIGEWFATTIKNEEFQRWFIITLITGGYVLLVGRVNFFAVTFVYLFGLFFYLKATEKKINMRSLASIAATALFATVLVAIAIPKLFNIPLPR